MRRRRAPDRLGMALVSEPQERLAGCRRNGLLLFDRGGRRVDDGCRLGGLRAEGPTADENI
jgi:hypothetical protein